MLFAISADERLFKDAFAFEEQVFGIGDRFDQNGKCACIARTPDIGQDLTAVSSGFKPKCSHAALTAFADGFLLSQVAKTPIF